MKKQFFAIILLLSLQTIDAAPSLLDICEAPIIGAVALTGAGYGTYQALTWPIIKQSGSAQIPARNPTNNIFTVTGRPLGLSGKGANFIFTAACLTTATACFFPPTRNSLSLFAGVTGTRLLIQSRGADQCNNSTASSPLDAVLYGIAGTTIINTTKYLYSFAFVQHLLAGIVGIEQPSSNLLTENESL